jgi:hypothetical protein
LEEPQKTLENLFNNLGIKVSKESIQRSIELSSFNKMKESENIYKNHNPFYKLNFVRKGGKNNEEVDDQIKEYIDSKTKLLINYK